MNEFGKPPDTAETPDFTGVDEPFALFEAWFADAVSKEPNDPNAMALATVDGEGMPNVRMVLLKGLDGTERPDRGFVFYTNLESAKGRELVANPMAALVFYWKSLRRQVRVRGTIEPVTTEEADAYFATRARESQKLDRQLFDDVGVGRIKQAHLPLKAGAHGLEARNLRLQLAGAFDQTRARLEATLTDDGVIGEVAECAKAEKRHQDLPWPAFAPIVHARTWGTGLTRDGASYRDRP